MRLTKKTTVMVIFVAGLIVFGVFVCTVLWSSPYREKGAALDFTKEVLLEDNVLFKVKFEKVVKGGFRNDGEIWYYIFADVIIDDNFRAYKYLNIDCIGLRTQTSPIRDSSQAAIHSDFVYTLGIDIETNQLNSTDINPIYWSGVYDVSKPDNLPQYLGEELELYEILEPDGTCKILSNSRRSIGSAQ